MESAIKIAIENGWRKDIFECDTTDFQGYVERGFHYQLETKKVSTAYPSKEKICLDPLFWQALEKGLGWKDEYDVRIKCADSVVGDYQLDIGWQEWEWNMHRFIDV